MLHTYMWYYWLYCQGLDIHKKVQSTVAKLVQITYIIVFVKDCNWYQVLMGLDLIENEELFIVLDINREKTGEIEEISSWFEPH